MNITLNKKIGIAAIFLICSALLYGFNTQEAHANPSFQLAPIVSSASTSTPQYLIRSSATATSTALVYDTYGLDSTSGNNNGTSNLAMTNNATLALYFVASSTVTRFVITLEYSNGTPGISCVSNPNGCDWYADNLTSDATVGADESILTPNTFSYTYASTTPGAATLLAGESRGAKLVRINAPMRYVRSIVSVQGANGSVYQMIVPIKERSN